jgi:HK97 family phage portal protein
MPVKLYKYKQGKVEEQDKDARVTMLNIDPNDTLNGYQLKKALVEDYLLGRGGYCYIERERNEVVALKYIPEEFISIYRDPNPLDKWFTIFCYDTEFYPWQFIKLLRNTKDGASGVGLCAEVSKALETAYNMLKYQLMLVKSGGNKKGFIKSTRKLGQEEIDLLKAAWQNLYANDQSNVVVLNNGLEFQEASNTSVEMQLNESKKTLQDEINNIFHITGDYYETFKTAIYPIVKAFETELNRVLLLEKEKGKYFFEFDVKEIIRANIKERYEAYKIAKEIGLKTLNELRRDENLNDIEGLDVVDFGLGSVLYDVNTKQYYTPNTGDIKGGDVTVSEDGDENISYSEHIPI